MFQRFSYTGLEKVYVIGILGKKMEYIDKWQRLVIIYLSDVLQKAWGHLVIY